MKKNHGTAPAQMSFNQFGQILNAFTLALPGALEGKDLKQVINALGMNGEKLTSDLKEMLRRLVWMKFPGYEYDQAALGEDCYLYYESWEPLDSFEHFRFVPVFRRRESENSSRSGLILEHARSMHANLGQLHAEEMIRRRLLVKKDSRFYLGQGWNVIFPGTVWKRTFGPVAAYYVPFITGDNGMGLMNLNGDELDKKCLWLVPEVR